MAGRSIWPRWRRWAVISGVLVVGAVGITACGRSTPSASQASPTGGSAARPSAGSAPSAAPARPPTESNPPGDIPDQQVFVPFAPPGAHFSVKVPEGWARTRTGDVVTFTDKLNSISVQERPAPAAPTEATVNAGVVPLLQAKVPQFAPGKISTVTRKAGKAVLLTYLGDSAPDPVTGKVVRDSFERYSFWTGGKEANLTLSGPKGADNVDPWKIVTDSLRWR